MDYMYGVTGQPLTCVSPLLKREDPWSGGNRSTSHDMGRRSSRPRPSHLQHMTTEALTWREETNSLRYLTDIQITDTSMISLQVNTVVYSSIQIQGSLTMLSTCIHNPHSRTPLPDRFHRAHSYQDSSLGGHHDIRTSHF